MCYADGTLLTEKHSGFIGKMKLQTVEVNSSSFFKCTCCCLFILNSVQLSDENLFD